MHRQCDLWQRTAGSTASRARKAPFIETDVARAETGASTGRAEWKADAEAASIMTGSMEGEATRHFRVSRLGNHTDVT